MDRRKIIWLVFSAVSIFSILFLSLAMRNEGQTQLADTHGVPTKTASIDALITAMKSWISRVNSLDQRLNSIEDRMEQGEDESDTNRTTDTVAVTRRDAGHISETDDSEPKPKRTNSVQMGMWMTDTIRTHEWDSEYTRQAEDELTDGLMEHLPEATLDEIECGKRFCRAVLAGKEMTGPELAPLLGTPPLLSDGFANVQEDGRLAVFFPRAGIRLEDLRAEAHAAQSN